MEQLASVAPLLSKIVKHKPRVVCFVGLGIAQIVKSHVLSVSHTKYSVKRPPHDKKGKDKDNRVTGYGLQPFKLCYDKSSNLPLFFDSIFPLTWENQMKE